MKVKILHTDYGFDEETVGNIVEAKAYHNYEGRLVGYDILGSELNKFRTEDFLDDDFPFFYSTAEVEVV